MGASKMISTPHFQAGWYKRFWLWLLLGIFLLVALFGVLGYFWLPGFAKSKLEVVLSEALHRPVSIQRLTVSPYALSVTIEGFQAGDVLSVARLHLDVSGASLLRGMPVVSEVRVEQPELHLVRESARRLNVSDLLDVWLADKKPDGPSPEFAVSNIVLEGGQVELVDRMVGRTQRLSDLKLEVPFVTNVASRQELYVEPRFSGRFNGAEFSIDGRLRPFGAVREGTLGLALDHLDLRPLLAYGPPLGLHKAQLGSRLQVDFQAPAGKTPVLSVKGDMDLIGLQADLRGGRISVNAPRLSARGIQADLAQARVALESLTLTGGKDGGALVLRQGGRATDFLRLAEGALSGLVLDLNQRRIMVAEGRLSVPDLALRRTREGRLDLLDIFSEPPVSEAEARSAPKSEPALIATVAPARPWSWSMTKFSIQDGRLRFGDDSLPRMKPLNVTGLSVNLGAVQSEGDVPVPLQAAASVNGKGRLGLKGSFSLKGDADLALDIRQVDMVALQGWAGDRFNALLTRGELSFQGRTQLQAGRAVMNGDLTLGRVSVLDRGNAEDLLRWKQLRLGRLSLSTQPMSLRVGDVALSDFYAKVSLNEQGQLNLKDVVKAAPPAPRSKVPAETAKAAAKPVPPMDIRIGRLSLAGGEVNFSDRFIRPNYSARLTDLSGRVEALVAGTLSPLELQGSVDGTAPLKVRGNIDPLSSPPNLDIQASARGIDMPAFSAYSGRYVGYAIEKGKLSVEVQYKVNQGQLTADNKLFLDQLTFGEKVESKDALSVPVNLAVALLKNSRGEIDIHLPISGSLNDPQFSVGGIVVKVLVNLVVKAVTSPFALLGSLFGGGEDLSYIDFAPGQVLPSAEAKPRMEALARALADRPALTLEITGRADPEQDKAGIKRATLDRKLRAAKLADQARRAGVAGALDEVTLTAEEYPVYLEKVYKREKIPDKPRNLVGMTKGLPSAEMEARLLAFFPAGESELRALAEQRGQRTQAWMLETGKISPERIFLLAPRVEAGKDKGAGNRVDFSLREQ